VSHLCSHRSEIYEAGKEATAEQAARARAGADNIGSEAQVGARWHGSERVLATAE
jgi:hypothetical protein